MVEALIALGVAVIIMAAITSMIISALSSAITAKNQDLATQYAKQGVEVLRNIGKTNWSYLSEKEDGNYCLGEGKTTLTGADYNLYPQKGCDRNIGIFIRQVQLEKFSPSSSCQNSSKVVVFVFWSDGKCANSNDQFCHSVRLESCLSNVSNVSE